MRKLTLFITIALALLAGVAAFDWWIDPYGEVWKPAALHEAEKRGCFVSQELIGNQYFAFKTAVFHDRPTRTFVVGSSRVLKIGAHPGEKSFSNLGYPGSSLNTILNVFRALPAKPVQTVYLGVESFWLNASYVPPDTNPSSYHVAEYALSRTTFVRAVEIARQAPYIFYHRWQQDQLGQHCVIGRIFPSIAWRLDGSRVWAWEIDSRFARIGATPFTHDLGAWRSGYYAHWTGLDRRRLAVLGQALALARSRGWRVIGFAPPEPAPMLRVLERDPRIAPEWNAFIALMPKVFARYGFRWAHVEDARTLPCKPSEFVDAFHADGACSARVRARLDEVARRLH